MSPHDPAGPPPEAMPSRFGGFELRRRLGAGGMGVVFDATSSSGRRVALKVIRPSGDADTRHRLTARLLREARLLQKISHPGIVRLLECGDIQDCVYLAMEYVEGVTLETIRRVRILELPLVLSIAEQLTATLSALHRDGMLHRDIKLSNVLIDRSGRVVLIDFGLAWSEDGTAITKTGEIMGTPGYVAPEILRGERASERSEQFALGKLLFEMSTCRQRQPLPGGTPPAMRFVLQLEPDWSRFPTEPAWHGVAGIVRTMSALEPEARYPSLDAAHAAIAGMFERGPGPADAPVAERSRTVLAGLLREVAATPALALAEPRPAEAGSTEVDPTRTTTRAPWSAYVAVVLLAFVAAYAVASRLDLGSHRGAPPAAVAADRERRALRQEIMTAVNAKLEANDIDGAREILDGCIELMGFEECRRTRDALLDRDADR